ncbi:NADH-quinone oxidoreductase subunit NuoF [Tautonia plasticadhaerens]|uniref:NADP-reducing hydrogenase subunit HndC n=1 Tax=Tautonia plasticadhaerens TaxID=2527974 RepID=A0A518H3G3_9BACT|nr:NADH-quinone oxidoreductase subunit NuoF [Tautonia plasticadhaerens]QDV35385.1 NADP-reducing hydrogenase subunit HndC [Tautonia plasticadhaerens]
MDLEELIALAESERAGRLPVEVRVCLAASCLGSGAGGVRDAIAGAIADRGLAGRVRLREVGCLRLCSEGPLVQVDSEGADPALYAKVDARLAPVIASAASGDPAEGIRLVDLGSPFFALQRPIVLENTGVVEPERIESSLAAGAYRSLHHALHELGPEGMIAEVTRSGLRGRGGAGYPTGLKWATVAKMPPGPKYVVCNADEGDPGAFMDRSVMESDPHRVLEGMAIAALAVGADRGYIYVRGEYPLAIARLDTAIRQARRLGLLGSMIFDSPFNFRVDLRIGAGAFVCGEETALMQSIEGRRGQPRPRPPYPAESGLWGCPTLINNVETFANIPAIIREGSDWFSAIGTEGSKGTKVFALAGKVRNSGLVEVPMGLPLRTIVDQIGGGAPEGSTTKAVQTGGPSGGCIPSGLFDTPVEYEALKALGSIMGSGGMIVMDQDDDMVGIARFFMKFCMDESCGKCVPCRAGTVQLYRMLDRIERGVAPAGELGRLEALCDLVKHASLCGLGQAAPNPVLSTLRFFRHEYESRLVSPDGDGARAPTPR